MEVVYGLIVAALYVLPYILAKIRKKENATAIGILNLFAGWTAIGWIGALVWAAMNNKKSVVPVPEVRPDPAPAQTRIGEPYVKQAPRSSQRHVSNAYFDSMLRMQTAVSQRNFEKAGHLVHENLDYIPGFVSDYKRTHSLSFDIRSIPALEQGGVVLALLGDNEGLVRMREIVASIRELKPWVEKVERHRYDLRLFREILDVVTAHPNCLQTDVKGLVGEADGHRVANLISYLEKAGEVVRIKEGRTYRLVPPDSSNTPIPSQKRTSESHRTDRKSPRLSKIDVSSLSYVPLPRSPLRWEEAQTSRERIPAPEAKAHFEVRDADWQITTVEKLLPSERPDTAFRQMHATNSGLVMIDDLGKADGLGQIEAAALCYDRDGKLALKKGFPHNVYRVSVHPLGSGLIAMSRDCVVHAYDDHLKPILETPLTEAPEILNLRKRFDIPDDQLKNHIRCVALSRKAGLYLFTAVDEAWCVDMGGKGLWGAKMPFQEGWRRVATPSSGFGTSAEVDQALALMGLSLPITPDDCKQRYRELAKQWHPDRHPRDPQTHSKMTALNAAAEVLTGVEGSTLPHYMGASFVREMEHTELNAAGIKVSVSVGMQAGEIHAADWIYAASFAASSNMVYLASYTGRVVLVNENGRGVRVYDIGSVPRRIVDTGDYLYLLTDTRLYVLCDDELHALVDTLDGGDLIIAQTGFGLLEKKRLRWFREDGRYLGSVLSKNPIRRVYAKGDGMVVETRQRRTVVLGVPTWWE